MTVIDSQTDSSAPMPGYTVGVVAERLGVPKATLRSWNQRYGVGPHGHLKGRHRLYNETDIATLMQMLQMVRSGASPATAAECAKAKIELGDGRPAEVSATEDAAELNSLAKRLDTLGMSELLDRSLRRRGVLGTWDDVCRPVFAEIVKRQIDMRCIDEEHALTWAVAGSLRHVVQRRRGLGPARIMLACTPGEHHLLPLEALAAALAESEIAVRMLGSDVPLPALVDALDRSRPTALVLWSHASNSGDIDAVEIAVRGSDRVFVAGDGWLGQDLPDSVKQLASLSEAVDVLAEWTRQARRGDGPGNVRRNRSQVLLP
jgi:DNA-binding transcriptional MerR regulator